MRYFIPPSLLRFSRQQDLGRCLQHPPDTQARYRENHAPEDQEHGQKPPRRDVLHLRDATGEFPVLGALLAHRDLQQVAGDGECGQAEGSPQPRARPKLSIPH
jgi:hypothetical protein